MRLQSSHGRARVCRCHPQRQLAHPEITCRISELRLKRFVWRNIRVFFLIIPDHLHSKHNNHRHAATGNLFIFTLLFHWKLVESKPEHPLQNISSNPVRSVGDRSGVHPLVPEHKWCALICFSTQTSRADFMHRSIAVPTLVPDCFQTGSRPVPGRESCRPCSRSRKAACVFLSPLHTVVGWSATGSRHRTWNKVRITC